MRAGSCPPAAHTDELRRLLFDDVMWVENAKRDHFDFVEKMRDLGVDVVELHDVLTETVADTRGRAWMLDRQIAPNQSGRARRRDPRLPRRTGLPGSWPSYLIGGLSTHDLPADCGRATRAGRDVAGYGVPPAAAAEHALHPRHHLLDLRRRTLEPAVLAGPAEETILITASTGSTPTSSARRSGGATPRSDWGMASLEGGDVMPTGNGKVLSG